MQYSEEGINRHLSLARMTSGISLMLGVWLFAASTVSLAYLMPAVGYFGFNGKYWTFALNQQLIISNILFFVTSALAMVFGAFVAFLGRT